MITTRLLVLCLFLSSLGMPVQGGELTSVDEPLDLVLAGGLVFSGDGGAGRLADIGIAGDRIAAVGDLSDWAAASRIDVTGLAVTPGFIDIHSHAVRDDADKSGIFLWPDAENYIRQGVTTAIGGPDGGSWYPISGLLDRIEANPAAINFGTFVGHNRIRQEVMGRADRAPTEHELRLMQQLVATAMREGAFGLSSGLKYVPGAYSETPELIALARVAGDFGGIYITHMREEGVGLLDSVRETIRIGEEAGLPAQITHHKAMGVSMWGRSADTLALVDDANARGVDVTSDQYPYTASSTGIKVLFPAWSLEGDKETRLDRLRDPDTRARVKAGLVENLEMDRGGNDLDRVAIAECRWGPSLNGKTLGEILDERSQDRTMANAAELVMELEEAGSCTAVYHAMDEGDVVRIMRHPRTMVASDGGIFMPGDDVPHPRNYGSFARVLGVYVREKGVLDLPTAIHKMSRMPADRIGLADRGRIEPGARADIAVFDPDRVIDRATFRQPHQFAEGMVHVLVNGQAVLLDGRMTGVRTGRVLRSAASGRTDRAPWSGEPPASVLFVGNSFTFYNNSLHTHLRNMLLAVEPQRVFPDGLKAMTISGARLADHEGGLEQMLGSYRWGAVVLQGHSLEAVDPEQRDAFRDTVGRFAEQVREHGARPLLFMTWAYSDQFGMTAELDEVYRSIGKAFGVTVVPIGLAFARADSGIEGIRLRAADGKHPTPAGSYLAACVLYAALYGRSPVPVDYDAGIEPELARSLRATAWRTVEDYYVAAP